MELVTYKNVVAAMGDSITEQNYGNSCRGYLTHAGMLSNHQLRLGIRAATGGFTTQQIKDIHLRTIIDSRPDYCVVLGGTNDVGAIPTIATKVTIDNLTFIYDALLCAGIVPIVCTIPPRKENANVLAALYRLNNWVRQTAMTRGLPLVDFHKILSDMTGGYASPDYTIDNVHPSKIGAKLMGAELARVMMKILPYYNVPLVSFETTANLVTNPLNLAGTNVDGIANGWSKIAGNGIYTAFVSEPVNTDVVGKWFTISKTDEPYVIFRNSGSAVVPGNKFAAALRFKLTDTDANTKIGFNMIKAPSVYNNIATYLVSEWALNTEACTIYREFTIPEDVTSIQFDLNISGAATLSMGQFTLINLTELGF